MFKKCFSEAVRVIKLFAFQFIKLEYGNACKNPVCM